MQPLIIRQPLQKEMQEILDLLTTLQLDSRDIRPEEVLAAFVDHKLVGLGRIKEHSDCSELCSLGVIPGYRGKRVGRALIQNLILNARQELYLVTVIPGYFRPNHFKISDEVPESLSEKLNYCESALPVQQKYVVMKYYH